MIVQCRDLESNHFWVDAGYECYTGGHLGQVVLTAMLAIAFFCLCGLFSLVFYDSNSLSPNLAAKAHGRVDFLMLIVKTVCHMSAVVCRGLFACLCPTSLAHDQR